MLVFCILFIFFHWFKVRWLEKKSWQIVCSQTEFWTRLFVSGKNVRNDRKTVKEVKGWRIVVKGLLKKDNKKVNGKRNECISE